MSLCPSPWYMKSECSYYRTHRASKKAELNISPVNSGALPCPFSAFELRLNGKVNAACLLIQDPVSRVRWADARCFSSSVISEFYIADLSHTVQSLGSETGAVRFPQPALRGLLCHRVCSSYAILGSGWEGLHKGAWRGSRGFDFMNAFLFLLLLGWFVCRGSVASSNTISVWTMGYPWRYAGFLVQ